MGSGGRRDGKASAEATSPADSTPPVFCAGWIWWSASAGAPRKPPKDDFDKRIPSDIRVEFHNLMKKYRDAPEELQHGLHFDNIGDDLWELRIKRHGNAYRLVFFRWGNRAVVLDVFRKTTQKTPKDRALIRKSGWLKSRGATPPA